ncbi:E3 ubiquitin-protein ligase RING1-like [Olea europaea var. sylvestris]|uniref:RING-type E3 ubiquitin transferase n=1 Tax=Olea europaea subsp. europaea TaxID=158383 RepID=A0A8S0UAM7_OLEEU|nr:E3 ubiquitin-protein ligase RING1-like [Olea europaea var. sylvestris]CAA3013805.1 E3 ubiquitin- ligase RING1-like [Olea europaea subsp. europaea]
MDSSESHVESESESLDIDFIEDLSSRAGATALLLPRIIRLATAASNTSATREIAVFVNQARGSVTLIEGSVDVESILREIPSKEGPLPASKASIESLPVVKVTEPDLECSICLEEFEVDGEVKEMPCKHKFHSGCIDKWLGLHGSCPVCRYKMPVEDKKEGESGEDELRRGGGGLRIHVFLARGSETREEDADSDLNTESGQGDGESGDENPGSETGIDDLPAQQMDTD